MRKLAYLLLAIITFVSYLVVTAPASIFAKHFEENLQGIAPGLKIWASEGSLWKGNMRGRYKKIGPIFISWDVDAFEILTGDFVAEIDLNGDGLQLTLILNASADDISLQNINGEIDTNFINIVSVNYGLSLAGEINVLNVFAALDYEWVTALSGTIDWTGGLIHLETPERLYSVPLLPLEGTLSLGDSNVLLNILSGNSNLMTLSLKKNGWSKADIASPLIDILGIPFPSGNQSNSEPVLTLEEKIF